MRYYYQIITKKPWPYGLRGGDKKMEDHEIIKRIEVTDHHRAVCLDGKEIFNLPTNNDIERIFCVGVSKTMTYNWIPELGGGEFEIGPNIFIGTGGCCQGNLYRLGMNEKSGNYELERCITLDTNAQDIIPIGHMHAAVAGRGCCGYGIRLVETHHGQYLPLVSSEEFKANNGGIVRATGFIVGKEGYITMINCGDQSRPFRHWRVEREEGIHRHLDIRLKQNKQKLMDFPINMMEGQIENLIENIGYRMKYDPEEKRFIIADETKMDFLREQHMLG